ncbi:MAG: helix-turn-helix domain-containing protein [Candidatus Rokubacteria bacterium]|nr:helix-turn-helix domain-containing protein [Candidatus Rokubacteria bacterium]
MTPRGAQDGSAAHARSPEKTAGGGPAASASVPTLDELAADPGRAATLSPAVRQALTLRCAAVLAALASASGAANGQAPEAPAEDRLLSVEAAARTLGVSVDWLYARAARLPFTVRLGRALRFSAHGVERYIRQRLGR